MQDSTPPDEKSPLSVGRRFSRLKSCLTLRSYPTRPQAHCL